MVTAASDGAAPLAPSDWLSRLALGSRLLARAAPGARARTFIASACLRRTVTGKPCVAWDDPFTLGQAYSYDAALPHSQAYAGLGSHNYCRSVARGVSAGAATRARAGRARARARHTSRGPALARSGTANPRGRAPPRPHPGSRALLARRVPARSRSPARSRWSFCAWCYVKSSKRAWDCCEIGAPQTSCELDPNAPSRWPTDAQGLARLAALRLGDEGAAASAYATASGRNQMIAASVAACCALFALAIRRRARDADVPRRV
eukprot:CAMPEP_0180038394 /NCGR_PEP_ID=MMETSP0984-20121128/32158_1 /TAXON_ID=483367 /ORGANISM="non described non described, Strain CCMP 2436" /LENGTH=262 /DNA_ID=CAMNT_0021965075 /DNA_START=249 /DNA_END=1038 /DNA_ORIENTATION=+